MAEDQNDTPEHLSEEVIGSVAEFDPIIKALPRDKQQEVKSALLSVAMASYRGPLPPPGLLAEYAKIVPDFPERIVKNWESETAHRHAQEDLLVKSHIANTNRGQWIGFILCLFFGSIAAYLGATGHDTLAGVVFTTTIIGVITVFVLGRMPAQSEPEPEPLPTPKPARSKKLKPR